MVNRRQMVGFLDLEAGTEGFPDDENPTVHAEDVHVGAIQVYGLEVDGEAAGGMDRLPGVRAKPRPTLPGAVEQIIWASTVIGSVRGLATGHLTAAYQAERDAARVALGELPDGDRVVAFDAYRARISRCPTRSRWPRGRAAKSFAGSWSSGSWSVTGSWRPSTGRRRPGRSSNDSGRAPKGIRTPDLHLERVAS